MHTNYRRAVTARQNYPYTDAARRQELRRAKKARTDARTRLLLREWDADTEDA